MKKNGTSVKSFHEWLFVDMDWKISSGRMKGKRYTLDAFPCWLDILREDSKRLCVMKSAQMAASEVVTLAWPFYALDVLGVNWGVMFPTQGAMRDFYKTRFKGAISANPKVAAAVRSENESNISVFGRNIFLRYTSTESAISTFDADGITVDEQDLHNQDSLYGARVSRSQGAMEEGYWFEISTPSYPGNGIDLSYENSSKKSWVVKCPACGADNAMNKKIGEYEVHESDLFFKEYLSEGRFKSWRDFHIPCSRCGKKIDPVSRLDEAKPSLGGGRWVAEHPSRDTSGYHLQVFQRVYAEGTAAVLKRARDGLLAANKPEHVRRWWQYTIGVPYINKEGRLSDEQIERCTTDEYNDRWFPDFENRDLYVIAGVHPDWIGVDVRDKQYHIIGLKRLKQEVSLVCMVGWVESSSVLLRLWERSGKPVFMIDAQPDTNESRVLVKAMGRRGMRGKFEGSLLKEWQNSSADQMVLVNRSSVMEGVQDRIKSGSWMIPRPALKVGAGINRGGVEETFSTHLKAPVLLLSENSMGNLIVDFPKEAMGGVDPHFFMAAALAHTASMGSVKPSSIVVVPR